MSTVVILIPCLLTGGTEVATLETAQAFRAQGYTVTVTVYFDEVDPTMLSTFEQAGVGVRCLGLKRGGGLTSAWRLIWRLFHAFGTTRHDLVWVQYMTPTLAPLLVARLFTPRLVAAVHVAAGHYSAAGLRRLRWLTRWWLTRLVCVSQTVAEGVFGKPGGDGMTDRRVVVIPNALDAEGAANKQALDWRGRYEWSDDCILIGFVGRLTHLKGVDVLLRALALLPRQGLQVRLLLVGAGEDREPLQRLVDSLRLQERVRFAGRLPRDQIYSAFKGFDIAVVPSRQEGFGLSALEAMACGVPLVASRVDALQEVVLDGETGLLCEPENPEDLARRLIELLHDRELQKRLGQAGVEHVRARYDRPACLGRIKQMIGVIS